MDLQCIELPSTANIVNVAKIDKNLYGDLRVVNYLLTDEQSFIPKCNYFEDVQTDIEPFMRKVVTTWMLEVCEEQVVEDQVLPLAINYMDRFLCVCKIKRQQLQLLGATCLLIASKIRSTNILGIDLLCAYTDYSVTYEHIVNWEMLVLSKLDWNMDAVTGFDYVDHIIERNTWGHENNLLRRHAHTLVSICYTEPELIRTAPSLIASACICSAIRGLKMLSSDIATRDICKLTQVDPISLELLIRFVDRAVEKVTHPQSDEERTEQSSQTKYVTTKDQFDSPKYGQPETPTEVENIYF